jgi:hypothetical protein
MRSVKTLPAISILAATLAGCYASGGVAYRAAYVPPPAPTVTVEATVAAPEPAAEVYVEPSPAVEIAYVEPTNYVYISPEVQVIENFDYPVFFYGGLYYRNEGGVWYSSSWHDRGWGVTYSAPNYITRIDRPMGYAHYHADVNARVGQPGYRAPSRPVINRPASPPRYVEHPGHPVRPAGVTSPTRPVATQPMHTATQPQPAHTGTQPQPMHTGTQPQPAHTTPQPQPMHTTQPTGTQPQPMHTQPQPQPTHTQPQPQPMHTQPQPQPTHTQPASNHPAPAAKPPAPRPAPSKKK